MRNFKREKPIMIELESLLPCIETKFHIWNPLEIVWIMNWHRTLRGDLYCTAHTTIVKQILWRWFTWLLNISTNGAISTFNLTQFNIPNKFQSTNCYMSTYNETTSLWNFVYEIFKEKKKKRYSFSYLKTTNVILILMRIYRTYSKFNFCVPSLFLQGGRIQIFVIIFRRLRFMESKVMRPVEFRMLWYTWKDIYCEEQLKKKKKREVRKKFVIGTNEYVQRIFIRIQDLFMRAISNDPKASSFGIFSKNRGINETIRIL